LRKLYWKTKSDSMHFHSACADAGAIKIELHVRVIGQQ
jgi:hypothetical protein